MPVILAFLSPLWAGLLGWAAKSVLYSNIFGAFGPIVSGFAKLIGGLFEAICEIVVSLSKSPEGRVVLAILAGGAGFLYLRFHYIEEGKAMVKPKTVVVEKPCQKPAFPAPRKPR